MNKALVMSLLCGALGLAQAQNATAPASPMVAPAPMPLPADTAAKAVAPAPVAAPIAQPAAAPAQPTPPAAAPAVPMAATAPTAPPVESKAAPAAAPQAAAPVAPKAATAPQAPVAPSPQAAEVAKSTSFTAEKIKPGKLNATAKADKNRPAKAENRDRWRSNRIERAERGHEISRNEGRRLRVQAVRLNKLEVKKEEGASLSPEALQLLDSLLVSDLELTYYAPQDKLWNPVSRELKRLEDPSAEPEEGKKAKYEQAEKRVPNFKK